MKTVFWLLIIFFIVCLTSAFWLDYFAMQRKRVQDLEKKAEKKDELLSHQAREMNRLSKERNFWIMETNRLRQKG